MVRRRIVVRGDDVLIVEGVEIYADVLKAIVDPDKRLLWTFVREADGSAIRPVAYSEERVIWLQDDDLHRQELPSGA